MRQPTTVINARNSYFAECKDEILRLYREGWGIRRIAEHCKVFYGRGSYGGIRDLLIKEGVKIRRPGGDNRPQKKKEAA